jgi:rubrerythrin
MSTVLDTLVTDLEEEAEHRFQLYERFAERASRIGHKQAAKLLRAIVLSEKGRLGLYRRCLTSLDEGVDVFDYYVCPRCGLVLGEDTFERCLLCNTPGSQFIEVS